MRCIVVGMGIQGKKRQNFAGKECVTTVDPVSPAAQYKDVREVAVDSYDAALVCTPDSPKVEVLRYLLENKKHVLVEKPLVGKSTDDLIMLKGLAEKNSVTLYTAYNHRFEPHIAKVKTIIDSGRLGNLYLMKMLYGNGTARDVRNSVWRDKGSGVLDDLGSHLLDTIEFLFGERRSDFLPIQFSQYENKANDYVFFGTPDKKDGRITLQCEATLLSWRNTFRFDLYGEKGSAHIDCLCKWGPSTLTVRERVLPSGKPPIESSTLEIVDPTWALEYEHFKKLCQKATNNIETDIWIFKTLKGLAGEKA